MLAKRIFTKSSTFLSVRKQEIIVDRLEQKFYEIILKYDHDEKGVANTKSALEAFLNELRENLIHYYFEDEFLEYLFNLHSFIGNYIEYLDKVHCGKQLDKNLFLNIKQRQKTSSAIYA